ncbi:MAG: aminomethyl-transferring glycine dehydrogenase [Bacteroidota bacterium]
MLNIQPPDRFSNRHLGPNDSELNEMLDLIGCEDLEQLVDETVPTSIRLERELDLPEAITEFEYLNDIKKIAAKNKVYRSFIGLGYYGTITPSVILRNIFENPGWYTQYTPYQAEISQGRLEALLNFQTVVSDLTGLPIANASLLDEGTAAAEAMSMFFDIKNKRNRGESINRIFVSDKVYPQTLDILMTRALPIGIEVVTGDWQTFEPDEKTFGVLLQYPNAEGAAEDYRAFSEKCSANGIYTIVAADLLSLTLLTPPGEWGADAVVGNTQRFGVPMGFGGPHAAYFATSEDFKRQIPGRIIGVSEDSQGNTALRMALQTREQHIRRDKATSNICTAQALLATMAGMYAVYHGPEGLKRIADQIHGHTVILEHKLTKLGFENTNVNYFDTVCISTTPELKEKIRENALSKGINFNYSIDSAVVIAFDETVQQQDINNIVAVFAESGGVVAAENGNAKSFDQLAEELESKLPSSLIRSSSFMDHPVFNSHHSETKMMRYIKKLENKDLSLMHSMIPLGSCTMKLNASTQLIPVSWEAFGGLHPFIPLDQAKGYLQIFTELEKWLSEITGFTACSLQPNSGAQGEYAGLLTIYAYHQDRGEGHRNIALIPSSAHGTNPASAVMCGLKVVVVKCDDHGNIDLEDLRTKAELHKDNLNSLMVTYPSTHGVFETSIKEICDIVHENGGKVYMDGANMNAQVGLTNPAIIGADVCHLNLHKTFSIPHGGGGPGMGPICVNDSLAPYLPSHVFAKTGGEKGIRAISSAPWSSASILLISYAYIRLLGKSGLIDSTKYAILNANYIKKRLEDDYPILYSGENGRAAHEMIVDLRQFKSLNIQAEDVAKRLMDYGFHAPTLSFPVAGTIMIEPTESEGKDELDRFCDALLQIHKEIEEVAAGTADAENNVLHNAPHSIGMITKDQWLHPYSREKAAFPLPFVADTKFWVAVGRVNNTLGDRNLICTCPPIEAYEEVE